MAGALTSVSKLPTVAEAVKGGEEEELGEGKGVINGNGDGTGEVG